MVQVLKGNIVQAPALGSCRSRSRGYLVLEDGVIRGVCDRLPLEYATAPLVDYGQALVMQSFADMHLHAPIPHAGHGHGPAAAGVAGHLTLPHGGTVCRYGLRPPHLSPSGHGPHHQRHHPCVYVLLPPTPTPRGSSWRSWSGPVSPAMWAR